MAPGQPLPHLGGGRGHFLRCKTTCSLKHVQDAHITTTNISTFKNVSSADNRCLKLHCKAASSQTAPLHARTRTVSVIPCYAQKMEQPDL